MIHITKTPANKFMVVTLGTNTEPNNTTEILETKQSVWVNIISTMRVWRTKMVLVQDDSFRVPKVMRIRILPTGRVTKEHFKKAIVAPKYVPGKNPKVVKSTTARLYIQH
jgi:hypothetical protein